MRSASIAQRLLSLFLCSLLITNGACVAPSLDPLAGWAEFLERSFIPVPGGWVNAGGGNLLVRRSDLSIDTLLGTQEITASYNAASGEWIWSFQMAYDGSRFTDPSGFSLPVDTVPDGEAVAGTHWVKIDADTLQSKGGMAYEFDTQGRLASQHWATFDYPRVQYVYGDGELTIEQCTVENVCAAFFVVALQEDGNPTRVTDARTARVCTYAYADGLLVQARTAQEYADSLSGTTYEYAGTLLAAITNSEGERVEYDYDSGRRIETVVQVGEGNPTHSFTHHPINSNQGYLYRTVYTNPLGGKVMMYFDGDRKLHEALYLDTEESRIVSWNAQRRALRDRHANGAVTEFEYDGDDLVQISEPSGNVVEITYEPGGLNLANPWRKAVRRVEDSIGLVGENTFDAEGRLETNRNGADEVDAYTYGFTVFPDSFTEASGITTTFPIYAAHGHWLEIETPESTDHRAFDAVGNALVVSAVRDRGGLLARSYDDNRALSTLGVAATDEDAAIVATGTIQVRRRSDGQIVSITRPGGGDHEFAFDAIGRVVEQRERVDGAWSVTSFSYDLAGNVASRTRPNGMRAEIDYDSYGRSMARRAFRDGQLEGELLFTYENGELSAAHDSIRGLSEIYAYDSAGRLRTTLFGFGEVLTREYDLRSQLTREVFSIPGAGVVADIGYAYDLVGRRVQIVDQLAGEVLVDQLFVDGRLTETLFGNDLLRRRAYDPDKGRLTGMVTENALQEVVETTEISYTFETRPARNQIRTQTSTALAATDEAYWIAPGGTLANPEEFVGKRVFGWSDGGRIERFAYDELGNRVSDAIGNDFSYNAERNRLLWADLAGSPAPISYVYDEAGFVTERAGLPITWTASGRIASFGSDSFAWDMSGRLLSMTVGGVERRFELFGGRVEGDPAQGTLGMLDLGGVALQLGTGERLYRHLDFRGNISFVSDDLGEIVSHHRYAPYGLDASFGPAGNTVTFVGKAQIGELMILGFRIYDPAIGRFLSPDPILQLVNQFSYTLGNPVWFSDPDGSEAGSVFPSDGARAAFILEMAVIACLAPGAAGGIWIFAALVMLWDASGAINVWPAGGVGGAGELESAGCAPVELTRIAASGWIFPLLLALQLVLGLLVLRGRKGRGGADG
ncbi:MAG: RHS repeat-associated core domain-containing protein [Deltaproteobacteria bacterium]|nr:RHS repeat-associated core domain-containing protein [Deltaproteobacteria bacterium]